MSTEPGDYNIAEDRVFELGEFALSGGEILRDARLVYATHGSLNAAGDNVILFPHMYSGTTRSLVSYIGTDKALDPSRYFIIVPAQLGNGESSSPSNTPPPHDRSRFPAVSISDDVRAQRRLLDHLGVTAIDLVLGWSMGAQQTYEWAVAYPEFVRRAAPIAGTARTTAANRLFVHTHAEALQLDPAFQGGEYAQATDVATGLRHHAHIFAATGASPDLYDRELFREIGFASQEEFVAGFWQAWFAPLDPNNLIALADKWARADVSSRTDGDLAAALGRITAKTFVLAFETDWFFPLSDIEAEAKLIPDAQVRVHDTAWGHFAAFGLTESDRNFLDTTLTELLQSRV